MAAAIFDLNFNILMLLAFFFIAFIYSSVGHGGASGYLSVMALFGIAPFLMKPSALVLNIFVSGVAFWQYYRAGHFRLKLFLPFAAASVPAAFIGGFIPVEPEVYRKTLGASLAVPAIRNFFTINPDKDFSSAHANTILSLIAGGAIGLLSGMIGIGGGIILSPLILLLNWANMKETACVSALFIFVNSFSGLFGFISAGSLPSSEIMPWIVAALAGGLLGAYTGSTKLNSKALGYLLSIVLLFASIKLIFF